MKKIINIEHIKDCIKIQGQHGNWNYNEYMFGFYNGLVCAYAVAKGISAKYRKAPKTWINDKIPKNFVPTVASE